MTPTTPAWHRAAYLLLGLASVLLFLKNAWVAEDAYITLRSVEQFLHGNGFRWNPHDRTQVYTSPLWFLLIVLTTAASKTLYLNLMALSLVMHILLLWVLARLAPDLRRWVAIVLLLTLSQAFFEFTGSGLEYPLAYVLLAAPLLLYARERHLEDRYWIALTSGLALISRHDLLLLLLPMLCHLLVVYVRALPFAQLVRLALVFAGPLLAWSLFSLLYYGVPFPNTAYAKLGIAGVPLADRFHRGLIYLGVSVKFDPVTPAILLAGTLKALATRQTRFAMMGLGVILAFLYVTSIGGDYMIGRFYAPLYLVATLALVLSPWQAPYVNRAAGLAMALACFWLLVLFLLCYQDTLQALIAAVGLPPLQGPEPVFMALGLVCSLLAILALAGPVRARQSVAAIFSLLLFHTTLQNDSPWLSGGPDWGKTNDYEIYVAIDTTSRERYWIYRWTSLFAWYHRNPEKMFPDHTWCERGTLTPRVTIMMNAGMPGYCMPLDHIGYDINGLVDPMIARMPKHPAVRWVPGGSVRIIPEGYPESLESGRNLVKDPDLARYYDVLRLLTQSDELFSTERLATIVRFNLGVYEPWRRAYIERVLANPPPAPDGL